MSLSTSANPTNLSKVERDLLVVPGVAGVEGWGGARGEIQDEKGDLVANLMIIAPPADTQLLDPDIVAGRWLIPGEKKAMVVSRIPSIISTQTCNLAIL